MLRGYRCVILAAFGWLILTGQQASSEQHAKQGQSAQHQQAAPQGAAPRPVGQLESPKPQQQTTCQNPKGETEISTCASIAQAAAANTANELSRRALSWNIAGIIVVTLTLLATAVASWAATSAVRHTRRIGEAQTRAYLSIKSVTANHFEFGLAFKVRVQNSGQSPALAAQVIIDLMCPDDTKVRMMPDVEHNIPAQSADNLAICYFNRAEAKSWDGSVVAICSVGYADVFGVLHTVKRMFAGIPAKWNADTPTKMAKGDDIASYLRAVTHEGDEKKD